MTSQVKLNRPTPQEDQEELEARRARRRSIMLLDTPQVDAPKDPTAELAQMDVAGQPAQAEQEQVGRKPREVLGTEWIPWLGALGTRIGGGLLSAPGFVYGAGVSGAAEGLAQKIESEDPIDAGAVTIEAGLGAIPGSAIIRGLKKVGVPVGRQIAANAARMAAYIQAGNMARRSYYESEDGMPGNPFPSNSGEMLSDLVTSGAGYGAGRWFSRFGPEDATKGPLAEQLGLNEDELAKLIREVPQTGTTGSAATDEIIKKHAGGVVSEPILVKAKEGAKKSPTGEVPLGQSKIAGAFEPEVNTEARRAAGGLRVAPQAAEPVRTVELPKDPITYAQTVNARSVEGVPLPREVQLALDEINARPSRVPREWLDSTGKPITPEAAQALAHEDAAKEVARTRVMERFYASQETKPAAARAKAEDAANRENLRNRVGGTDVGKIESDAAKSQAIAEKDRSKLFAEQEKAHGTANKLLADEEQQEKAKTAIADAIKANELVPDTPVVRKTTVSVPTDTGKQTLSQTLRPKPKPAEDDFGAELDNIDPAPRGPLPVAPKNQKIVIQKTDPDVITKTRYTSHDKAVEALAGSGRSGGQIVGMARNWRIVFDAEPKSAAPKASAPVTEVPAVTPKPVETAPAAKPETQAVKIEAEVNKPPQEPPPPAPVVAKPKPAPKKPSGGAAAAPETPVGTGSRSTGNSSMDARLRRQDRKTAQRLQKRAAIQMAGAAQKPVETPQAPVKGAVAPKPTETPVAAPKPVPEAPKPTTSMSKKEIDAVTREDVAKWTPAELAAAKAKFPKDKRLQTIIADEIKTRNTNPKTEAPATPAKPETPKHTAPTKAAEPAKASAKQPAVKGFEGPDREPTAKPVGTANTQNSYEKMATESGLPPETVKIDLTGAKDAKEVKNRVVNEIQKYRQKVQKYEDSRGVDEKGQYTYSEPFPNTFSVHVPGGPTYTLKPDLKQIDGALSRFEKGFSEKHSSAGTFKVDPDEAFKGIVDEVPKPTHAKVAVDHGSNFGAKGDGGRAPSYKLPLAPIAKKPDSPKPPPTSGGEAKPAPKKGLKVAAKDRPTSGSPEAPKAEAKKPVHQKFIEHQQLAAKWLEYNGQKPTEKNLVRAMRQTPEQLREMLAKRGIKTEAPKAGPKAEARPLGESKPTESTGKLADLALEEKSAWDKYFDLKQGGKSTPEEIRAAGKAAGEVRAKLATAVKEAQAKGEPIPTFLQKQADAPAPKAKAPAGKGPTNEDIAKMSPEEQESTLRKVVEKFKGKKITDEKGIISSELITQLGLSAAGAAAGAATTPDDPLYGAIIGGSVGLYGPAIFRNMYRYRNSMPKGKARDQAEKSLGQWTKDRVSGIVHLLPDYYRASYLAKFPNLPLNAWAGPYGAATMGAVEAAMSGDKRGLKALKLLYTNPIKNTKDYFGDSMKEARGRVTDSMERGDIADVEALGHGWKKEIITAPATAMTAGDIAARKILMKAGFTELEARALTLTSEPHSGIAKSIGSFRKAKGAKGTVSIAAKMMLPFYRTASNQIEQSALRLFGNGLREHWNQAPVSVRQRAAELGISTAVGVGSFALGASVPPESAPLVLKAINNFFGPYGATASAAFLIGASYQKSDELGDAVKKGLWRYVQTGAPLPTADVAQEWINFAGDTFSGKFSPPYGTIPSPLSSKEQYSIPTAVRRLTGDPEWTHPTKDEYGPIPMIFTDRPKLKPKPKTEYERKIDQIKADRAKQRKAMREAG